MTVNFIYSGQKVFVEKSPEGLRGIKLKPGIYSIEFSREEGFFLLGISDKYILPEKTYGNQQKAAEKVINTHLSKTGNTGVLLTGLKGTGKSLFVKVISNNLIDLGVPIIQINKAYPGEDIFNFVENLGDCGVIFDEFGKNYSPYSGSREASQVSLLSLFDGLTNSRRIHLFTENNTETISEFLINRPGRVHYHFRYNRLPLAVIEELCKDAELPDKIIEEMKALSSRLKVLSFDVVKCLINEWKLYGGTLIEHLKILNISLCNDPENEIHTLISVTKPNGEAVAIDKMKVSRRDTYFYVDPIDRSTRGFGDDISLTFTMDESIKIVDNVYHFLTQSGHHVVIKVQD